MKYILFATGIFAMILGTAGLLPLIDATPLPMAETWNAAQIMAAIHMSLQTALVAIGAILLAVVPCAR